MNTLKLIVSSGLFAAVHLVSLPAFAERESPGKVPSYDCDDGTRDGGYGFTVTDFNDRVQDVLVLEKTRRGRNELLKLKLRRIEIVNGSHSVFYGAQDGLSITMIRPARAQGPMTSA